MWVVGKPRIVISDALAVPRRYCGCLIGFACLSSELRRASYWPNLASDLSWRTMIENAPILSSQRRFCEAIPAQQNVARPVGVLHHPHPQEKSHPSLGSLREITEAAKIMTMTIAASLRDKAVTLCTKDETSDDRRSIENDSIAASHAPG